MSGSAAYKRAAILWFITTALVVFVADSHFDSGTADLLSWIPFAMCLRSLWKWRQIKKSDEK